MTAAMTSKQRQSTVQAVPCWEVGNRLQPSGKGPGRAAAYLLLGNTEDTDLRWEKVISLSCPSFF